MRSFCWLIYIDGGDLKIQSPNNLGDLALHITYIRNFANGVALWPDNPIFVASKLRYPAGTDVFNAVLTLLGVDLIRGLVWAGLLGSVATFYALWRWGRRICHRRIPVQRRDSRFRIFSDVEVRRLPG